MLAFQCRNTQDVIWWVTYILEGITSAKVDCTRVRESVWVDFSRYDMVFALKLIQIF